jgi:hypothetical protein
MPSPCQITSGQTLGCRDNVGGIKNMWILSGSISAITEANGAISSVTGTGQFYKFELFRETSDYNETTTVTPENGTVMVEQTLNAVFFKMSVSQRNNVRLLSGNQNIKIIVQTNNTGSTDQFLLMGTYNGASLISSTAGTGVAMGDRNGYALVFTAKETEPASYFNTSTGAQGMQALFTGITFNSGSQFGPA